MKIQPTKFGYIFIFIVLFFNFIAFVQPGVIPAAFASISTALLIVCISSTVFSLRGIEVSREAHDDGQALSIFILPLRIKNHLRRKRQHFFIREVIPFSAYQEDLILIEGLMPEENRYVSRKVNVNRRGKYEISAIELIGGDPLGFFRKIRTVDCPETVYVKAAVQALNWLPMKMRGDVRISKLAQPSPASGAGQEFYGVRDYRYSDGIRFIDWKASARQRHLQVREFEENVVTQICIFLDCYEDSINQNSLENNFETLISMSSSLLHYLSGIHCRVLLSTGNGESIEGPSQYVYKKAEEHLMNLKPDKINIREQIEGASESIHRNAIIYCLTMNEPKDLERCYETLLSRHSDIRWFHAPKALFEDFVDSKKEAAIMRIASRRQHIVKPVIVTPVDDIQQLFTTIE